MVNKGLHEKEQNKFSKKKQIVSSGDVTLDLS